MTDNELSLWELQARLIYAVLVAGKSAEFAEMKTLALVGNRVDDLPFQIINDHIVCGDIEDWLRRERTGSYGRLVKCLPDLIRLDPHNCTIQELEAVHGVGPKTSRFYILWTRPDAMCAALDTHVLKWLRSLGYDAPKSTPQTGARYEELEQAFLREAKERGTTPRELDYEIWAWYATRGNQ
ncbi:hypothetical protein LCGC14_1754610 [marine sediment metagenome]|uniref:HhH-GPD domain-containing protein n=1 Tax=marine sediment metagenome TaxID=412755 RepID=A0A0F9K2G8_9ZZZZ